MAGTNLYWGRGEQALQALAEARGIPVFLNGLARGCVPADHALAFARARKTALGRGRRRARRRRADGLPARLRRGVRARTRDRRDRRRRARARPPARGRGRALRRPAVDAERARGGRRAGHARAGSSELRAIETEKRAAELAQLQDPRAPLHPMRVYGELAQVLDRDAIVIGDGGDFVSFAGRVVDSYKPGLLAGPGPVRLPRQRPGLRAGGQARAPRPPGRAAARRRRVRLPRDGVRHARPPRRRASWA